MGFEKPRVAAMTDGVFAVAITLLVMDLAAKAEHTVSSHGWWPLAVRTGLFAMSFVVVALYWIAHHNEYAMLIDLRNRWVIWLNLLFLLPIVLLPLPLALAGQMGTDPKIRQDSLGLYMLDLGAAGLLLAWFFYYAAGSRNQHVIPDKRPDVAETHYRNLFPAVAYLLFGFCTIFTNLPIAVSWTVVILVPITYLLWQVRAGVAN